MKKKLFFATSFGLMVLFVLLVFLTACGGGTDEAVEDTSGTDTGAVEDGADTEAIADDNPSATGSEEDSGELPPTPETGSKVSATRITPAQVADTDTAVATTTPPANRINSENPSTGSTIDLVLVIDATGSMAPELNQLHASLDEVAAGFATLPGSPTLRFGYVIYRDKSKEESTQRFPLTDNWNLFAENLLTVTAVSGGDYPEDVTSGLYQAIANMNWQPDATKLLILLGDAPPQSGDQTAPTLPDTAALATERGITIYTIGSDGLDEAGTAVFQQIAQAHNGRYIYLTDTPEALPSDATTVYPITDLPTLLVDIVAEIADALSP